MSTHLVVRDLTVSFNGFMAVNGLDLTINKGELRCLIGPNGAGKTTCLDLICGKVKPTAGTIVFDGKHLESLEEYTIARSGVVYAPGRAGTEQELFSDSAQNSLTLYKVRSPMVLFGSEYFERDRPELLAALRHQSATFGWETLLAVCDYPQEALLFVQAHDPDAEGTATSIGSQA